MDCKELRIGNWINFYDNDTVFEVIEIDNKGVKVKNDFEETWIELDRFEGIKLSQEWLERVGFISDKAGRFTTTQKATNVKDWQMSLWIIDNKVKWNINEFMSYEIKTLNQLQNLYFSLVGVELEIKN